MATVLWGDRGKLVFPIETSGVRFVGNAARLPEKQEQAKVLASLSAIRNVSPNDGFRSDDGAPAPIAGACQNSGGCRTLTWTAPRGGSMPLRRIGAAIAIVVFLFALARISSVVVDWAWFSSIRYVDVFWTAFAAKAALFLFVFAVSTLVLWANATLALRFASKPQPRLPAALNPAFVTFQAPPGPWAGSHGLQLSPWVWRLLILAVAVILGLLIALGETGRWDLILRFIYQAPYGGNDPLFDKDIGFYLFSLPVYVAVKNWLLWILLLATLMAGAIYFLHDDISLDPPWSVSSAAVAHGSALIGLFFAVQAWSYALDRYLLLYNDNGVVVGAGYTDVHVELPALWLLIVLAAVAAIVAWANVRLRSVPLVIAAALLVFGGAFVFAEAIPALFERFYVKPSELQLETPYIQRNIALTREAYNLGQITVKPFPAEQDLTFQSLQNDSETVNNIRLWDWRPLLNSYAQLQEIRTYYRFLDVDVDRYHLGGSYQQVMLSARELMPSLLSANAQTWVNLHLLFTHGNGVVMSPVTEKSAEGLPIFYLKDIPPAAAGGPPITEPRIYFGQGETGYVIVETATPEFDYPRGKDNAYTRYDGADGVPIGGGAWRSLFAWTFDDVNILLSGYITGESKILLHRDIQDRVQTIAPFLQLDRDPYIVVSDGRLYWIQDAYTTSDWFPYAKPESAGGDIDYIRNSVKIVIDAYNGTTTFYVADAADPIVATYRKIFPSLFKPLDAMPPDLHQHIRYPEDLFTIQALQYRAYHMDAPEVFYNREDLWQFPREPTAPDGVETGGETRMAPYYIMMRLPGEAQTELFLMLPMTPSQRENMIAWLAARCDPPEYGKLIVYEFPKEKLVYGPFQIEALINQNTEISQQISLWNQMGSRVIRGNLLVVPIGNSILYVSPLYLRAQSGQLPELKRVIAAYGDRVVMEDTLPAALAALFKESVPAAGLPALAAPSPSGPADERARQALADYDRAIERLKAGDWAGFGTELDALRPLLEELSRQPAGR
jgi:uncharacterized protein